MSKNFIGILSGGAGTRLWPLSREEAPKQFYSLGTTDRPLLIDTMLRLQDFGPISIITTETLSKSTLGLARRYELECEIIAEPEARNTAPAVALFTYLALKKDPAACVGLFPADHLIKNNESFHRALKDAFKIAATGKILTLGIEPTYPSDAYGYIKLGEKNGNTEARPVLQFIEKPSVDRAQDLIKEGSVVWNAGMFIFSAKAMAEKFEKHMPALWNDISKIKEDLSNLKEIYSKQEKISIDYGIMEKLHDLLCVPADIGWTDVGSWEEISKQSNVKQDTMTVDGVKNFHVSMLPTPKKVAYIGVSDIITIDTPDALLCMKQGSGQKVRNIVEQLRKDNSSLTTRHSFEERPWGRFEVLLDTPYFKSKRITVYPGQKLSYQSHKSRSEHWVIVKGKALVTLDGKDIELSYGQNIFIPQGAKHRIANPSKELVEFIEVQIGSYFGEDDIIRYEDSYGRT